MRDRRDMPGWELSVKYDNPDGAHRVPGPADSVVPAPDDTLTITSATPTPVGQSITIDKVFWSFVPTTWVIETGVSPGESVDVRFESSSGEKSSFSGVFLVD